MLLQAWIFHAAADEDRIYSTLLETYVCNEPLCNDFVS